MKADSARGLRSLVRRFFREVFVLVCYTLLSLVLVYCLLLRNGTSGLFDDSRAQSAFGTMIMGTAPQPYVTRALVPLMTRGAALFIPGSVCAAVREAVETRVEKGIFVNWNTTQPCLVFVAVGIIFLTFVAAAYSFRAGIAAFYEYGDSVSDLGPILGLLFVPVLFLSDHLKIYDSFTLLSFSLVPVLAFQGKKKWFYVLFVLSAVNRETSALFTCFFVIGEWGKMSRRLLLRHVIAQGIIWMAVRGVLALVYSHNPGTNFVVFVSENLRFLAQTGSFRWWYFVVTIAVLTSLTVYRWSEKPVFLRWCFASSALILVALDFLFGLLRETRLFFELIPLVFFLAVPGIASLYNGGRASQPAADSSLLS